MNQNNIFIRLEKKEEYREVETENFDRQFPPKEKLKLPGQIF